MVLWVTRRNEWVRNKMDTENHDRQIGDENENDT